MEEMLFVLSIGILISSFVIQKFLKNRFWNYGKVIKIFLFYFSAVLFLSCNYSYVSKDEKIVTEDFLEWAKVNAVDLPMDGDSNNSEFSALGKAIGESQVVAVSEAAHNTREFLKMNARIVRYLVEEKGFTKVVCESGFPESKIVNEYINGGFVNKSDWIASINGMYGRWKEFTDMIEYLREHNSKVKDEKQKVQFYGIDIAGFYNDLIPAFEVATNYLERVDALYSEKAKKSILPILKIVKAEKPRTSPKRFRENLSISQRYNLERDVVLLINHFTENKDKFIRKTSEDDFEYSRQSIITLFQAINYYNRGVEKENKDIAKKVGMNGREIAMFKNFKWVYERDTTAKIVIINHNIHSMSASGYLDKDMGFFTSMGAFIKNKFGDKYYKIGCAYNTGKYWANWKKNEEREIKDTEPAEEGEIDYLLKSVGKPCFFVDFRKIKADRPAYYWLEQEINNREHDEVWPVTPSAFDGFIYYENISMPTENRVTNTN